MGISVYSDADQMLSHSFKESITLDMREVTRRLIGALGGTLVSTLAGAKDIKAAHSWAKKNGAKPRAKAEERLRFAYHQLQRLSAAEGENVAKVWFIGANPWLDYETPVMAIRQDKLKETSIAVNALIQDSFSG